MSDHIIITDTIPTLLEAFMALLLYESVFQRKGFSRQNPVKSTLFCVLFVIVSYWATLYTPMGFHTLIIVGSLVILVSYFTRENVYASIFLGILFVMLITAVEIPSLYIFSALANSTPDKFLENLESRLIFTYLCKAAECAAVLLIPFKKLDIGRFKLFKKENNFITSYVLQVGLLGFLFFWVNKAAGDEGTSSVYYFLVASVFMIILVVGVLDYSERTKTIIRHLRLENDNLELRRLTDELTDLNRRMKNEIDARIAYEHKINQMAYHDALTSLPNRSFLLEKLNEFLADSMHKGKRIALFFIDIDNFKSVNDMYGHLFGDDLLKEAAKRFESRLDRQAVITRHGGDEFVILQVCNEGAKEAGSIAGFLSGLFKEPWNINGREIFVTVSMGITIFPDDG